MRRKFSSAYLAKSTDQASVRGQICQLSCIHLVYPASDLQSVFAEFSAFNRRFETH
jgi:hypothetical protein